MPILFHSINLSHNFKFIPQQMPLQTSTMMSYNTCSNKYTLTCTHVLYSELCMRSDSNEPPLISFQMKKVSVLMSAIKGNLHHYHATSVIYGNHQRLLLEAQLKMDSAKRFFMSSCFLS